MTQSPQGAQPANNLRVRRTKILLREALIELIEERGFEALTIGELTERAMVSRAAFYRNYQDKYDLVEQIFEEAMSALLSAVEDLGREHPQCARAVRRPHAARSVVLRALSRRHAWFSRPSRALAHPNPRRGGARGRRHRDGAAASRALDDAAVLRLRGGDRGLRCRTSRV